MKVNTSMAIEELAGKDGKVVARRSKFGTVFTPYLIPNNPNTGPQERIRDFFGRASRTFSALSLAQVAQWKAYANTLTFRDPVTGKLYHPEDINAFMQLAVKFLQLNPSGTIPVTPPAAPFLGDPAVVTATSTTGKVTFNSNQPNQSGVRTELLLQRLKGPNWNPQPGAYRSQKFVQFAPGSLSSDVDVAPGWYAPAYRFVLAATGQATEIVPLPVRQVSLSVQAGGTGGKRKAA
ncbi:MAG: hypothetical protein KF884_09940 [Fimbriimonadaceae bacterium]|nr:hypothetical protein [Fimbriimonadaceae bacterium]QYK57866.1 MAG: hypothetical protein KF884_09940 [Fimbriimonadaceae bacterium]